MSRTSTIAQRILTMFESLLGMQIPLRVRAWDGSEAGVPGSVTIVFENRRALRHVLWAPGELGLVRAYVSGDLDIEGDVLELLSLPGLTKNLGAAGIGSVPKKELVAAAASLVALGAVGPRPAPPAIEARPRRGVKHSRSRDSSSVSHHYDVGNDFYRILLGPSMVYSCAYWAQDDGLDKAQFDKLDLVCRKLGLAPGMRLLDVGCGWGSMAIHAARHYGVSVVGVTLSQEQFQWAVERVAAEGLSGLVEIRVQDYRDVTDGPYDAVSSIGMSEHVGDAQLAEYARTLFGLLRPKGRLLNHAIASVASIADRGAEVNAHMSEFIERYIFPDGEILPLSRTLDAFERAGLETRDSESLREHYAITLRAWIARLRGEWDRVVDLVGEPRARTWLLYLAGSALGFEEASRLTIHQVLAVRPDEDGVSGLPRTRTQWLGDPRETADRL
ncbi:SAM-dependent methyltransferase [Rhodococcoides yunnanense]|uniref:SAM-dependent methyltransferase n=1 Tax=Rhodococcoides yunnanense TaxID=278209 RepID=UPI000933A2C7|nr:cyclopropane-fatty-acyl-phospholipid synthase family protein [Rhodococcus yunnanensis]